MEVKLTPPINAKPLTALRSSSHQSKILADIDSQIDNNIYRDADPVTWGHETCHGIASRIRKAEGRGRNGFYVLNGEYVCLAEPACKLADVAGVVKPAHRGIIFDLYLKQQQRYWNDQPSYVLDEAWAYLNGTLVGCELDQHRRSADSFVRSLEMAGYAMYLLRLAPSVELRHVVGCLAARNADVYTAMVGTKFMTDGVEKAYLRFAEAANG